MKCVLVAVVFTVCSVVAMPAGPPPGVAICPPKPDDGPPPGVAICPPHFDDTDFHRPMTLEYKFPFEGQLDPGFALRPDFMLPLIPRPPRPPIEPFVLRVPEDDEVPKIAICPSKPE